jgi:threonyl-tRNA synthetase
MTIQLTLPDGSIRDVESGITGLAFAHTIGASLGKAALAIECDGILMDLQIPLVENGRVRIITGKDPEGLEIIRHDAAHLLAQAVKELFPETQVTIGPAIENGFYYDFARQTPFSLTDLDLIEQRMKDIIQRDDAIIREEWDRDEAVQFFREQGELFKAEIIESIPPKEVISLYRQGSFIDLCRGPHAPSTGRVKAVKLMKLAGAYWRGDSRGPQLQRIYGTAWADEKQLKAYLTQLEEAEKRDHRRLGREMNLFHVQEEAPGMVFWHHHGWTLYRTIEQYIRLHLQQHGYQEVRTPILVDRSLWEASGHWEKFRENMFTSDTEERVHALKPMNCPCHVQIFNQGITSYRDLPLRMAEFGACHRYEPSGALHGLMRVRGFTQDDAHIFCTEEQITSETIAFCQLLQKIYRDFGFTDILVKFSDRPEKRAGSDAVWDKAEQALRDAVESAGLPYSMNPGEGAFYGPKLEFVLRDTIGRDWQCGTLQVDFVLPERLGAYYVGSDGLKHHPVMLHRAIIGSFERFIGILIEHFAGRFPFWLAPLQVVVLTITQEADEYAQQVLALLKKNGIRAQLDLSNEKISYKIRHHSLAKVPLLVVLGKQEMQDGLVSMRRLGSEAQHVMELDEALAQLAIEASMPSIS